MTNSEIEVTRRALRTKYYRIVVQSGREECEK